MNKGTFEPDRVQEWSFYTSYSPNKEGEMVGPNIYLAQNENANFESEVKPIEFLAYFNISFKSDLFIEPIGLKSAAEQSYFVT